MTKHRLVAFAFLLAALGACGGRSKLISAKGDGGSELGDNSDVAARSDGGKLADAAGADRPTMATDALEMAPRPDSGRVVPPVLSAIELAPPSVTIGVGIRYRGFVVTAVYTDGTTGDVTAAASLTEVDASILQVSEQTVTGLKAGATRVQARLGNLTASAAVTVTASPLVGITIDGVAPIAVGQSILLAATGTFADGTKQDVSAVATWTYDTSIVAVAPDSASGKAKVTGVKAGAGSIGATFAGITGKTPITVTAATMTRIDLTPVQPILQQGVIRTFQATALYTDGSTGDVTLQAVWSSSDSAVATVSAGATSVLVKAVTAGITTISATVGAIQGSTKVTVTQPTLVSVVLAPASWSTSVGGIQAFIATGTFSDGSTGDLTLSATWSSSSPDIVSVANATGGEGLATALAAGSATVSATVSGVTASAAVMVSAASLTSIMVTPDPQALVLGLKAAMTATGSYQDGTTQDLTAQVAWSVTDATIITVSNGAGTAGQVTGIGVGSTSVVATLSGISGKATVTVGEAKLVAITVAPATASVTAGVIQAFTAIGTYDDGSTPDLTTQVAWRSSDMEVAQIANAAGSQGVASTLIAGTTTITASFGGLSGTATLSVGEPLLSSLVISPASASIQVGDVQLLSMTAVYANGTLSIGDGTWTSSNPAVATLAPDKASSQVLATGLAVGTTTITLSYQGLSTSALLTVTAEPTMIGLTITPTTPPALLVGANQRFVASAVWNNGSTTTVTRSATWTSSNTEVATMSNGGGPAGRATGLAVGVTTITAVYEGFTASVALTVRDPAVTSLVVTPSAAMVQIGDTQAFIARASYEDGTTSGVTQSAAWTTSDGEVASIGTGGGRRGVATGLAAGTVIVTVTYEGVSATASLTVSSATPTSLLLTPVEAAIQVGELEAFTATLVYSDDTTLVVTRDASWGSSNASVATVTTAGGGGPARLVGRATGLTAGITTITASYGGFTGSATLTVAEADLVTVQVTPADAIVPVRGTLELTATAVFSDDTTRDVTRLCEWTSSDAKVAAVGSSPATFGRVSGLDEGLATITATYGGKAGTTVLTVADIRSLSVTPTSPITVSGLPVAFSATAILSNGATVDVTARADWVSSDVSVAAISPAGVATGSAAGTATITATYVGVSGRSSLTVSSAVLEAIAIAPSPVTLVAGGSQQLLATGSYSDATTRDLTAVATWLSSTDTVSVSNAAGSRGLLVGLASGAANVTASYQGVTSPSLAVTVQ